MFVNTDGRILLRYTAQATPNDRKRVVINVKEIVPRMAGNIPPFVMPLVEHPDNLKILNWLPFEKTSQKMRHNIPQTVTVLPNNNIH
jgi:hypothetical protein